jgi:tetratricopeptide (TPR) repeat protein
MIGETVSSKEWGQPVVHWLERAIAHDPGDLDAWQAKAGALSELRATAESLAALEILLAKAPRTELALVDAARCARRLRQGKMAQDYWRRAIAMNPWMAWYAREFAEVSALQGDWPEALAQSEASLRLDPANVESRVQYIKALVKTGNKEKAQAELLKLKALHPPQWEQLQAWLAKEGS